MKQVFEEGKGPLRCGATAAEEEGWKLLAMGFTKALGNVDRHRIQKRDDARRYAMNTLGTASLILTQLRYEHGAWFNEPN